MPLGVFLSSVDHPFIEPLHGEGERQPYLADDDNHGTHLRDGNLLVVAGELVPEVLLGGRGRQRRFSLILGELVYHLSSQYPYKGVSPHAKREMSTVSVPCGARHNPSSPLLLPPQQISGTTFAFTE
jgi:hypothetical protein